MVHCGKQQRGARQSLIFGHVCFLIAYFLNLCTLSPLVHADTLRRAAQTKHAAPHHCSSPGPAASTAKSSEPQQPPEPFCCEVRGAHNKAVPPSSPQLLDSSRCVDMILLPYPKAPTGETPQQFLVQEPYPSSFPPRYLSLAVLLL
jgi:hypothetical protein